MRAFNKSDLAARPTIAPTIAPQLADTIPPVDIPREPLPTKRPRQHSVVAWRHLGGIAAQSFPTLESAQEYARALSHLAFYQYAILCGREFVEQGKVIEPHDWAEQWAAFERHCAANGIG